MPVCLHLKRSYSDVWRWAERHWRWLCAFLSLSLIKYVTILLYGEMRGEVGRGHTRTGGGVWRGGGQGGGSLEELVTSEMASWLLKSRCGGRGERGRSPGRSAGLSLGLGLKPEPPAAATAKGVIQHNSGQSVVVDMGSNEPWRAAAAAAGGSDISGLASENVGWGWGPTYNPTPRTPFLRMHHFCSPLPPRRRPLNVI